MPVMNERPRYSLSRTGAKLYWADVDEQAMWRIDTTPESPTSVHAAFASQLLETPLGRRQWSMLCEMEDGTAAWTDAMLNIECLDKQLAPASASWQISLFGDGSFLLDID